MRRITALTSALALLALLAGAPAAATSLEDERTAELLATVAADDPTAVITAPAVTAIAPSSVAEIEIDPFPPLPSLETTSNLFRGNILYDLDARPSDRFLDATPFDGIDAFAEGLVIGLNEVDLEDVRVSN